MLKPYKATIDRWLWPDVFKNQDLLPLARDAGMRGLWLGIEDLTAGLVKKGQTVEKTKTLFKLLLKQGIAPMPMMMHHDGQPLWTWRGLYGLLNQVRFLRRAGAATCQVTLLTPWVGSQGYEQPFRDGLVLGKAGGQPIEQYQFDGNHCLATSDAHELYSRFGFHPVEDPATWMERVKPFPDER